MRPATRNRRPALPPVTAAHRRAAFELLAIKDTTFTQALRDPLKRRLIEACAKTIRNREAAATRTQRLPF